MAFGGPAMPHTELKEIKEVLKNVPNRIQQSQNNIEKNRFCQPNPARKQAWPTPKT